MNRPCLKCGVVIAAGSRCSECRPRQQYQRGTKGRTATDWRWRKTSQRLRKASPFCEECASTTDLTVDHRVPISRGGAVYAIKNLAVLCRQCNARKGNR